MRKWLLGLVIAGGIGVAAVLRSKMNHRKVLENHQKALEYAETFLRTLSFSGIAEVTNTTLLIPNKGAWVDQYVGRIGEEDFLFAMTVHGEPLSVGSNQERTYTLKWRTATINAVVQPADGDPTPHIFERIHVALKRVFRENNGSQPL